MALTKEEKRKSYEPELDGQFVVVEGRFYPMGLGARAFGFVLQCESTLVPWKSSCTCPERV